MTNNKNSSLHGACRLQRLWPLIKKLISDFMNLIQSNLVKVLREFGVIGVITYVGGSVIVFGVFNEQNFRKQILFGVLGFFILGLSVVIAYFRIKAQRDREQALIDMVKNIGNRLAEQVAKNLTNEQVVSISQTIWQNQKDLIMAILTDSEREFKKSSLA
ncbi:MAG: hypothetical protein WC650_02345 [Candidatus Doudnabacteria bacterium]